MWNRISEWIDRHIYHLRIRRRQGDCVRYALGREAAKFISELGWWCK